MDTQEESQVNKVRDLQEQVRNARNILCFLEDMLKKETRELQNICQHDFIRESDDDYHNTRFYHVCTKCQYVTR